MREDFIYFCSFLKIKFKDIIIDHAYVFYESLDIHLNFKYKEK